MIEIWWEYVYIHILICYKPLNPQHGVLNSCRNSTVTPSPRSTEPSHGACTSDRRTVWLGDDDSVETIKHRRGLNNNHTKKESTYLWLTSTCLKSMIQYVQWTHKIMIIIISFMSSSSAASSFISIYIYTYIYIYTVHINITINYKDTIYLVASKQSDRFFGPQRPLVPNLSCTNIA